MTKQEFLEGLSRALYSTGSNALIEENIRFYSSYIDDEVSKGRSMEQIMEELGEPRLIANSIKAANGYSDEFSGGYDEVEESGESFREKEREDKAGFRVYNISPITVVIALVAVLMVIIFIAAVILGGLRAFYPVLLPFIVLYIVFFMGRKRR